MLKIESYAVRPLLYEGYGNNNTKWFKVSNINLSQDELNFIESLQQYIYSTFHRLFYNQIKFKFFIDLRTENIAKIYFYPIATGIYYTNNHQKNHIELTLEHQKKQIELTLKQLAEITHL